MKSQLGWFVATALVSAAAPGCTAFAPTEELGSNSAAVGPEGQLPPGGVGYTIAISEIDVGAVVDYNEISNGQYFSDDQGYVEWAELAVRVDHLDPTTNTNVKGTVSPVQCDYGPVSPGSVLTTCKDSPQTPLWSSGVLQLPVVVYSPTDTVNVALALDNIEQNSPTGLNPALANDLAVLGNAGQAVGGAVGLANFAAASGSLDWAAGPIIGAIGSVLAVAGAVLASEGGSKASLGGPYTCLGGLMANPTSNPNGYGLPQKGAANLGTRDSLYLMFSPQDLENRTLGGTSTYEADVSAGEPGQMCYSTHKIKLSITRDWTTGPAVSPKSADSATIDFHNGDMPTSPTSTPASQIESFWPNASSNTIDRRVLGPGGWLTSSVLTDDIWKSLRATTPVASLSRAPGYLDAFWIDEDGELEDAQWGPNHLGATRTTVLAGGSVPPNAMLSAANRGPNSLDVFYIGNNGALDANDWEAATLWAPMATLTALQIAPPGGGVAAIARRPDTADVLFTGKDGEVYWTYWSAGSNWATMSIAPAGTATNGVGAITMVARSTELLDAFFVGANGAIYRSSWSQANAAGTNEGWQTTPITSPRTASPGAPISAVSRLNGNIDIIFMAQSNLDWTTWQGGSSFTPPVVLASAVQGPISIVASNSTSLDAFYLNVSAQPATSHWNFATNTWSTSPFPYATANVGGLLTLGNTAGNCLDVYKGGATAGTEIDSATCNGTGSQRFALNVDGRIVSTTNSTLCVDYSTPSRVQLQPCGGFNQEFTFVGGTLVAQLGVSAGQCLDVLDASTASGTQVDLAPCNGTVAQYFLPFNIPAVLMANKLGSSTLECLGVADVNFNVEVVTEPCSAATTVTMNGLGELQLPLTPDDLIDTSGASCLSMLEGPTLASFEPCSPSSPMWQWTYRGGQLQPLYDFAQYPQSYCLDVLDANTAPGARVDIVGCNGTVAQNWVFTRVDNTPWPWAEVP